MARQLSLAREPRFLIYGRGNGRGHATRTAALCRALADLGVSPHLYLDAACREIAITLGVDPGKILTAKPNDNGTGWQRSLTDLDPTDVIVDTFPEGLDREVNPQRLATARWVTLLRCRRDTETTDFRRALAAYSEAYDIEPHLEWAPTGVRRFGAVIRNLYPLPNGQPFTHQVLLVDTESAHRSFLAKLQVRLCDRGLVVRRYPNVECPREQAPLATVEDLWANAVVGPAGYNLTYELASLGVWHLALPAPREFDCQELRAQRVATCANSPEAVERRVLAWIEYHSRRPPLRCRSMAELAIELLTSSR